MTRPTVFFGLIAAALLCQTAASALPLRHPGLWRQTTETRITANPEFTPEERAVYEKLLRGGNKTTDQCVTAEMNHLEKQKLQWSEKLLKSNKVCEVDRRETQFSSTFKMECRKTGHVSTIRTVWKGDTYFTTDMITKTPRKDGAIESNIHTVGKFVGADCGNVKAPFVPRTLGVKNDRGPGEPPLFEAFQRYCIETKANYGQIEKIANDPASIFRQEWQADYQKETRWQVGGPFTYLTAHTGKSAFTRRNYDSCRMSAQRVDAASLEAMRQWLGPKSMPTLGWSQDFLWDGEKRTPVSMEKARDLIAAGTVVWQLRVSKSQPDKETSFTLSRPTN